MGESEVTPRDAYEVCHYCGFWMIDHEVTTGGDLVHPNGETICETVEQADLLGKSEGKPAPQRETVEQRVRGALKPFLFKKVTPNLVNRISSVLEELLDQIVKERKQ